MTKKVGSTVLGVNIGCQAFSRCCLNAVLFARSFGQFLEPLEILFHLDPRSSPASPLMKRPSWLFTRVDRLPARLE